MCNMFCNMRLKLRVAGRNLIRYESLVKYGSSCMDCKVSYEPDLVATICKLCFMILISTRFLYSCVLRVL